MEHSKPKLSPEEVFNNKRNFSKKIHVRVLKVIADISASFDKFEIVNDETERLFLNAVNHYCHDLFMVIFHLRKIVIKIDDDQSIRDVITDLSRIVLSIQEFLNLETEKLKIHMEATVIHVGFLVEKVTKIILICDNLTEPKQNLLDCQLDLLNSGKTLKLYMQCAHFSIPELEGLLHGTIETLKSNLNQIKSGHELLLEDFSHYTRYFIQYIQNKIDYMREMNNTENFCKSMVNVLKDVEVLCQANFSDILEAASCDNPVKQVLDTLDNCDKRVGIASAAIQEELQSAMVKDIENHGNETVKQLLIHIFIGGIIGISSFSHIVEDCFMKQKE